MEAERSSLLVGVLYALLGLAWLADGWLSLLRVSLVRLPWPDLAALREDPDRHRATLDLLHHRTQLGWLVQSGLLFTHFTLAALSATLIWPLGQNGPLPGLGWLLLAAALLWAWEWTLTQLVQRNRAQWAHRLTLGARWLLRLGRPWLGLIQRIHGPVEDPLPPKEALDTLLHVARAGNGQEDEERRLLASMARFGETLVREIMVPRIDMVALEVHTDLPTALDTFIRTGFSRLPVYRDSIDQIIGLLYAKDLLPIWRERRQVESLEPLLRQPYFVPEAKKVSELLTEMQARRIHMAIVVDEYGGVAGLVTLEDIVEEIIGEIQDEYDRPAEALYRRVSDDEYLLSGRLDLDDLNALLGTHLDKEAVDADTLGGLIYSRIGQVPQGGEQVRVENLMLTVEKVEGRRIAWVRARRLPAEEEEPNHAHA